jgi:hypothetical protein
MLNVAAELKGALYWLALALLASIRLDLTRLDFKLLSPFVDYEDKCCLKEPISARVFAVSYVMLIFPELASHCDIKNVV